MLINHNYDSKRHIAHACAFWASRFTSKERDAESGNDYFPARQYSSNMGRFMSPDPLGGSLANPQTLNRYAYVVNNPLSFTDPTGLYHCEGGVGDNQDDCNSADGMWTADPGDLGYEQIASGGANTLTFSGSMSTPGSDGSGQSSAGPNATQSSGESSGSFDPNSTAGQLFGAQGAPYWIGANNVVQKATIGATIAYGGASLAPAVGGAASAAGQYAANATGLLGPAANRVFWSAIGSSAAANWAEENGGTTLEMTPLGSLANWAQGYLPQAPTTGAIWNWLSMGFASGAKGPVTYLQGGYLGHTWLYTELPILVQQGNPITTVPIP